MGRLLLIIFFFPLCHSVNSSLHSQGHMFSSSLSFAMQLVLARSCPLPESSSKICTLAIHSFIVFCPKGSSFPFVHSFHRPKHLFLYVPTLVVHAPPDFRKLPLHTPPLSNLKTCHFDDWCLCSSTLNILFLKIFARH